LLGISREDPWGFPNRALPISSEFSRYIRP